MNNENYPNHYKMKPFRPEHRGKRLEVEFSSAKISGGRQPSPPLLFELPLCILRPRPKTALNLLSKRYPKGSQGRALAGGDVGNYKRADKR